MFLHVTVEVGMATVIAVTRLIAYAINDDKRWARFRNLCLFIVFLALAIAAAASWWLLGDGGLQVLLNDFGRASIAATR